MSGFLDSSIVLDLLANNDRAKRFARLTRFLERVWCSSLLVRMECRVRVLKEGDVQGQARVDEIVGSTRLLALTDEVFERAALVRAQTGLKTPDALHVATALAHGCAELWTADERLARTTVSDRRPARRVDSPCAPRPRRPHRPLPRGATRALPGRGEGERPALDPR